MRNKIALGIFWVGLFLAFYVGGWVIIGASIMNAVVLFSAGSGTSWTIIGTILKCFGGIVIGSAITLIGYITAAFIS